MTEPIHTQGSVPTEPAPGFLLWREVDRLDRRIDSTEQRVDRMDANGPRGMEALRQDVARLRTDLAEHEGVHQKAAEAAVAARRWYVATIVGLVTPLYPLIIWLIQRGAS